MIVRLTTRALSDLDNILTYIEAENPTAAQMVSARIEASLSLLTKMPKIGRPSVRPNTREFVVRRLPFLIVYRLQTDTIEVLTIFHTSQHPDTKN